MSEARRHERKPVFFPGRIVLGTKSLPCTITDLSPAGARILVFAAAFQNLSNFTLQFLAPTAVARKCVVRWKPAPHLGVEFQD